MFGSSFGGSYGMGGGMGGGMYGGSSMYGSSMYGGSTMYGSGMSNYGMNNNNLQQNQLDPQSNDPQQQQQQQQQRHFRDEYQGLLMGFNSLLNIAGASMGLLGYGGTFLHYMKSALTWAFSGLQNIAFRVLGIAHLKRLFAWATGSEGLIHTIKAVNTANGGGRSLAQSLMGKLFFFLRVLSGIAFLAIYFMQHRLKKQMRSEEQKRDSSIPSVSIEDTDVIANNILEEKDIVEQMVEMQVEIQEAAEIEADTEDKLKDAFEDVIIAEKDNVKNTQVRSEEFWTHKEEVPVKQNTVASLETSPQTGIEQATINTSGEAPSSFPLNTFPSFTSVAAEGAFADTYPPNVQFEIPTDFSSSSSMISSSIESPQQQPPKLNKIASNRAMPWRK